METEAEFTHNIHFDDSYIELVANIRKSLALYLKVSHDSITFQRNPNELTCNKYLDPLEFLEVLCRTMREENFSGTLFLPDDYFSKICSVSLFHEYFFGLRIKSGSCTVGEWVRHIAMCLLHTQENGKKESKEGKE
ncbi:MAG: hypothetical protein Q4F84_08385 [Fibrobacter sp.]|nr:hypothetical protein [Fibrobacter sp.]